MRILAVIALLLAGAACSDDEGGDDDLSAEEQAYVDAIVAAAEADDGADDRDVLFGLGDPRCLAPHYVRTIGVDRLQAAWGEPDEIRPDPADIELSDEEAAALYDASGACGTDLREVAIDGIIEQTGGDPSLRSCLEGALTDEGVRAMVVNSFQNEQEEIASALARGTFDDQAVDEAVGGMIRCYAEPFGRDD